MIHPTAEVSEGTNRNMPARNTLVQLLATYTNPESRNAKRYRQTDRQTDGQQDYANSRSYCLAVQSAKTACTIAHDVVVLLGHAVTIAVVLSPMD